MKSNNNNNVLTLYLSGRIDANNAPDIEAEIAQELAKFPESIPAFDASELEYISSAGLRVILKFRKQFGKNIDVLNVSSEVYDIFEVTGFTELLNVRKRLREVSVEGCPVIGTGHYATVYRIDPERIIKLFDREAVTLAKIEHDQKVARDAFIKGIPTAISYDVVKSGEHYGIVYEMINADTMNMILQRSPERIPELSRKAGALLRQLHRTEFEPGSLPDAVENWRNVLAKIFGLGLISAAENDMISELLDRIPPRNTFIHYDFHPNNILLQGDELVLIDVGDAALGYPAFDLSSIYYIVALVPPMMKRMGQTLEQTMGVPEDIMRGYWSNLLPEYFGTADTPKLQAYEKAIAGYAAVRQLFSVGGHFCERYQEHANVLSIDKMKPVIHEIVKGIEQVKDTFGRIEGI